MTEQKRRGRPPKQVTEATAIEPMHPHLTAEVVTVANDAAQAYALRVWNGQTDTLPRNERMRRVALALEGQGLTMEGVVLP